MVCVSSSDEEGVGIVSFRQQNATSRDTLLGKLMGQLLCSLLAALVDVIVEGDIDGVHPVA